MCPVRTIFVHVYSESRLIHAMCFFVLNHVIDVDGELGYYDESYRTPLRKLLKTFFFQRAYS